LTLTVFPFPSLILLLHVSLKNKSFKYFMFHDIDGDLVRLLGTWLGPGLLKGSPLEVVGRSCARCQLT